MPKNSSLQINNEDDQPKQAESKKKKSPSMKDYLNMLKYYYLPVATLAIFLFIAAFAVYPSIADLSATMSHLGELRTSSKEKDDEIGKLQVLEADATQTNQYLNAINKIAPIRETNVVDFQKDIRGVANTNRLDVEDARGGEEIISDDNSIYQFQLVEVPMNFTLVGSFEDMKQFLSDIYNLSNDFIVIEDMQFSRTNQNNDKWSMDITLVKYQFIEKEEAKNDSPTSSNVVVVVEEQKTPTAVSEVPIDARPNQKVLDFLDNKYLSKEN